MTCRTERGLGDQIMTDQVIDIERRALRWGQIIEDLQEGGGILVDKAQGEKEQFWMT